ncbi:sugar kinase [Microvirga thermotolerans]|uniref:Sugar kinase n=1 Tax=Microvirga thermotolerans TaxID=2651334 RepID=A0A5P9JWW3_9HYPH|nr:sugar kinase [Microvirga thermotolerans]QFU17312.1 sugar kinase [Microvirga thermotolerans]
MKSIDILAIGEPLMEFAEVRRGGERLYLPGFGGDVSNTAVAAARQGAKAAIFTALGDDAFGREILALWDREGVDRSSVILRAGGRTGVYFIGYGEEGHVFSYARAGSAASLVRPGELPLDRIAAARVLHASGISQAISGDCADAVFAAIRHAKASGTAVSYDTNLRLRLWPLDRARAVIHAAVALSDIALPGLDDARQLTGLDRPEDICAFYLGLGCRIVALTMGKAGTMVATPERREVIPARPVEAVDATGAGDTFDGAFLAEWLVHGDPFRAAAYANAAAALSTLGQGGVGPMPTRQAVESFLRAA